MLETVVRENLKRSAVSEILKLTSLATNNHAKVTETTFLDLDRLKFPIKQLKCDATVFK